MTNHAMAARELKGGQTRAVFWHSEASLTQKNSRLKISTDLLKFSTSRFVRLRRDFIPHLTRAGRGSLGDSSIDLEGPVF